MLLFIAACRLRHKEAAFLPTKQNITVSPGERAVLRCKVEHLGTKTVSFLSL